MNPLKINEAFFPALQTDKRYTLLYGSRASGKSYFAAQLAIITLLSNPNANILVIRKVKETIKNSIYTDLINIITTNDLIDMFHTTVSPIAIHRKNCNAQIHFVGCDKPHKLKSISGINMIIIEEALELELNDWNEILPILGRSKEDINSRIIMMFNPQDERHWLNQLFFKTDKHAEDSLIIHTDMFDNDFLSQATKDQIKLFYENDEFLNQVYVKGFWGTLNSGIVFNNWEVSKTISDDYKDYDNAIAGLDFGFDHLDAFVAVSLSGESIIIFDEVCNNNQTRDKLFSSIRSKPVKIIADSADPRTIAEMRSMGFNVTGAVKGAGSIEEGIDFMRRYKILIHPKCVNTIREISTFHYKIDKNTGKPVREYINSNNDTISAIRYATEQYRNDLYNTNKATVDLNPYFIINKKVKQSEHFFN